MKRQKVSVVFNYSSIELTPAMETLLNRGLNFAITPLKLNLSQVLCDFQKFERTIIWQEYWANQPQSEYVAPIFKKQKTNYPSKHPTPQGIKMFLNAAKSEISDIKGFNKTRPNLPPQEQKALHQLVNLQRERKIVIKPCDKVAGIIILDFDAYIESCNTYFSSTQKQHDGSEKNYYEKVSSDTLDVAKQKILNTLKEALEKGYMNEDEFAAMDPSEKRPGKFYETFKVHKSHTPGETLPERPIISGSGSITENVSLFVEHYLKETAKSHPTFLQDTPDFLRFIEEVNNEGPLPENTILASIDVTGLYTNIPQDEGLQAVGDALDGNKLPFPKEFLVNLLELTLKYNIFQFNSELFLQIIGTAMGIRPAPSHADIFMARIDKLATSLGTKFGEGIHPI